MDSSTGRAAFSVTPGFALRLIWHLWRGVVSCAWLWVTGARDLTVTLYLRDVRVSHTISSE